MKNKILKVFNIFLELSRKVIVFLSGHKKYDKFVIISRSRTGSTLLMTLLNNHENIICEGELFQRLNGKSFEKIWNSFFIKQPKHIKQVGFKLFYYHPIDGDKRVWEKLFKDKSIKIIHLKRRNKLKALVSREIAERTNRWAEYKHNKQTISTENKKIKLDFDKCINTFNEIEFYEIKTKNQFSNHKYLEVDYESLVDESNKVIHDIFDILEVSYQNVSALNKKQNPESLKELIVNYKELKEQFSDTKWHIFFEE